MIGNMLDLARSREGGGLAIAKKPADVAEIVQEVVHEVETSHPGRKIAVLVEGDTHAEIDADRIAQLVCNLASNALAYSTSSSTVEIAIDGRAWELALSVHNEGEPIPIDLQERIFMPYKRATHADVGAPSLRGLGLGLFIVGEITRAHGGTVSVSSTSDCGTTFTVRLPRATETHAADSHDFCSP
jgi:signal transduction histidine kinase